MDRFIIRENIRRFERMLDGADSRGLATVARLLEEERRKLKALETDSLAEEAEKPPGPPGAHP